MCGASHVLHTLFTDSGVTPQVTAFLRNYVLTPAFTREKLALTPAEPHFSEVHPAVCHVGFSDQGGGPVSGSRGPQCLTCAGGSAVADIPVQGQNHVPTSLCPSGLPRVLRVGLGQIKGPVSEEDTAVLIRLYPGSWGPAAEPQFLSGNPSLDEICPPISACIYLL